MKRQRGRNRKPNQTNPNRAFESNGPDGAKIRGGAQHVFERYQQLARDASASGDRVLAESYLQHAEHYFRVLRTLQPQRAFTELAARDPFVGAYEIDLEDEDDGEDGEDGGEADASPPRGGYDGPKDGQRDAPRDGQRQDRSRNDRFERPREDRPRDDRPRDDRPREAREERPRDDRPRDDRPREERPRDDRPKDERPGEDGGRRETRRERYERRREERRNRMQSEQDEPGETRIDSGEAPVVNVEAMQVIAPHVEAPFPEVAAAPVEKPRPVPAPRAERAPRRQTRPEVDELSTLPAFLQTPVTLPPREPVAESDDPDAAPAPRRRRKKADAAEEA